MLDAEIFVRSKNHPPRTIPEKVDLANQAVQILALSLVLVRIPATLLVVLLCIQRQREDVGLWKVLYGPQVSLNWCLIWEIWVSSATINPLHFCGRTVQSMVGLACVNAQYWQSSSSGQQRQGQGRPIGLLLDWLLKADQYDDAQSHKKMGVGTFDDRVAARARVHEHEGHESFLQVERPQNEDEDEEPRRIP